MEEKLKRFSNCFESEEIKDADKFEDDAVDFRNWFVDLKFNEIQPNFDVLFEICMKIAMHYRPKVQQCGSDCLYIMMKEAAPAQIAMKREDLQKTYDKLIQIGHNEVLPSVIPAVAEKIEIVFKNTSEKCFNDFMLHFLETWSREATTAETSYVFGQYYRKILQHMGMTSARYMEPSLKVIGKRIQQSKSKAHIKQYMSCIRVLVEQCRPVIASVKDEVMELVKTSLENTENAETVKEETQKIEELLATAQPEPRDWSIA